MVIRSRSKQALTCGKRVKIAQQTPSFGRQISFRTSRKFGLSELAFLPTFFSARMDWGSEKPSLSGVHFTGISHPSRSIPRTFGPDSSLWNSSFMLQTKIFNCSTTDVKRVALCFAWSFASGLRFDIQMQAKNLNSNHRSPQVSLYLSHFPAWLFQNCVPQ